MTTTQPKTLEFAIDQVRALLKMPGIDNILSIVYIDSTQAAFAHSADDETKERIAKKLESMQNKNTADLASEFRSQIEVLCKQGDDEVNASLRLAGRVFGQANPKKVLKDTLFMIVAAIAEVGKRKAVN